MAGSGFGRHAATVGLVAACLALTACAGAPQAELAANQLPDLSVDGLEKVDCGQFAEQALEPIEAPYVRECWTGAPETTFTRQADDILTIITSASDAVDVTEAICPEDVLIDAVAYACRAAADEDIMYRVVVAVPDPASIVSGLPDEPTEAQIDEAVTGVPIQVVVQTEQTPQE